MARTPIGKVKEATDAKAESGATRRKPPKAAHEVVVARPSPSGRQWSPQQQAIFGWFQKPTVQHLVVRARAGTGKTTTIVEAINHITGRSASILFCAFNKRIAVELASRITDGRAQAKTLHAVGFGFLREQWGGDVVVEPDVEWERIEMGAAQEKAGLSKEERTLAHKLLGRAKGSAPDGELDVLIDLLESLDDAAAIEPDRIPVLARTVRHAMKASLLPDDEGRISFDDMIFVPLMNDWLRPSYDWVIVDEAQDMNTSQLQLAQAVVKPGGHLVFVGDEKQAIYGFRGADSGCLDRLREETAAAELGLTVTYRCPRRVVAEANRLVADFSAAPTAPEGEILSMRYDLMLAEVEPGDVILSRVNAPLVGLCLGLIARRISAVVAGRDLGKGLAEVVKKLKATTVAEFSEKLRAWAEKRRGQLRDLHAGEDRKSKKALERKLGELADRVACLEALADGAENVQAISDRLLKLFADVGSSKSIVTCSTVHKAKGLEWRRVFLLEETLYPRRRWKRDDEERREVDDEGEERNIHYVAVTRAQETLVKVWDVPGMGSGR